MWEIADIGILVIFRGKATILATKIALLQSKRLYPDEIENAVDMHPVDYMVGFGRLLKSDSEYRSHVKPRTFHFSPGSKYRALAYAALATIPEMKVGCRVIKADHLDSKLGAVKLRKSSSPTFQQVAGTPLDPNFWTLHNFRSGFGARLPGGPPGRYQPV